jgi:hypothetical protein
MAFPTILGAWRRMEEDGGGWRRMEEAGGG